MYFVYYACTTKLRFSSWSCGSVLRVLRLYYKGAFFPAGAAEVYFAYYACTTKSRFSSWSCGSVLRVLHLYYKVAIFQLELRKRTSRTALAEVYFAYYTCTEKFGFSSLICQVEENEGGKRDNVKKVVGEGWGVFIHAQVPLFFARSPRVLGTDP